MRPHDVVIPVFILRSLWETAFAIQLSQVYCNVQYMSTPRLSWTQPRPSSTSIAPDLCETMTLSVHCLCRRTECQSIRKPQRCWSAVPLSCSWVLPHSRWAGTERVTLIMGPLLLERCIRCVWTLAQSPACGRRERYPLHATLNGRRVCDLDFGQGTMLYTAKVNGKARDMLASPHSELLALPSCNQTSL
jgi:hypothetical protein